MEQQILAITGHLHTRYLGVLLIVGNLSYQDCALIFDRIKRRLAGWKTRSLSYASKLVLIMVVLQGYYLYWSGVLGLPGSHEGD